MTRVFETLREETRAAWRIGLTCLLLLAPTATAAAGVGTARESFVDASRPTKASPPFEGASDRRLDTWIWYPAEGADDDQARTGDCGVQPIIDRQIVAEIHEVGEAEARRAGAEGGVGARQAGQFRIGGGSENDVARALAEIDRLAAIGDAARLCRQQMHAPAPQRPPSAALMAVRSSGLRPITTRRLWRASSACQSRSK